MPNEVHQVAKPSALEFLSTFRESFVAGMGGGAAVVATLASAFAPKLVNPVLVGLTALCCGVLSAYAIWAEEREERLKLQERLAPRPFITLEYSQNATEEEPNLCDTMIFENIGDETAVSIDFITEPPTFGYSKPYLAWGALTRLIPGDKKEVSVLSINTYVRDIRAAIKRRDRRVGDVRVPIIVTCSDRREQNWTNRHALVADEYSIRIEAITGRVPTWTDLSNLD